MNKEIILILQKIPEKSSISDSGLANALKIEIYKVRYYLDQMDKLGLIKQIKSSTFTTNGEVYTVLRVTPKGKMLLQGEITIDDNPTSISNNRTININQGNYNENIEGDYIEVSEKKHLNVEIKKF